MKAIQLPSQQGLARNGFASRTSNAAKPAAMGASMERVNYRVFEARDTNSSQVRAENPVVKTRYVCILLMVIGVLTTTQAQVQTYTCPAPGFGPVAIAPFIPLSSLKTVPNPVLPNGAKGAVRGDLADYIANQAAAIQLGKALFWDMQTGSDGKTACATCHHRAGADTRDRNQLNPGPNGRWDYHSVNQVLTSSDFPFTALPSHDTDNVAGSQGVRKSTFKGFGKAGVESIALAADSVFNVGGVNVRQVTGKNTPTAINAVFNHRQFHDGRAQAIFNGVNPFGTRDPSAKVWSLSASGTPVQIGIQVQNASLASQAVGPPLNTTEMSAAGRTFADIGTKLLAVKPLGLQKVDPNDSVLGTLADPAGKGLNVTYVSLIQKAFQPKWWNSTKKVSVNGKAYGMTEANASLFWGLAVMLYEATLVADDSPLDQYLATRVFDANGLMVSHDPTPLDQVVNRLASNGITPSDGTTVSRNGILNGLSLFELPVPPPPSPTPPPAGTGVGCNLCHVGAETTSASMQNLVGHGVEVGGAVFQNAGFDLRMERMFMRIPPVPAGTTTVTYDPATYAVTSTVINGAPAAEVAPITVYDAGWYNIGVRPTGDDAGLGGKDPFGNFLSWTQFFQASPYTSNVKVPGGGLGCAQSPPAAPATSPFAGEVLNSVSGFPILSGALLKNEATDVAGSFKTSSLRNVELDGPYFHNGGKATLRGVLEFYDDGGNFDNPTKSPLVHPLGMTQQQLTDLVSFLIAFTDERVRWEKAPFDHPQLLVPNGDNPAGTDTMLEVPATGAAGAVTPLKPFISANPFTPN
jgi:cytochrome c peroxidase